MHSLLYLHYVDIFYDPGQVNQIAFTYMLLIKIELTGELIKTVKFILVHVPCKTIKPNAPSMPYTFNTTPSKYSKHYLREFQEETITKKKSYLIYCQCNDGNAFSHSRETFDDHWTIPYDPFVL